MGRIKDLTGRRFGKLTVVSISNNRAKDRTALWICKCDCGNIKEIRSQSLKHGDTKSCGCLAKEKTSERSKIFPGRASFNNLYYKYKESAKNRNLTFLLSKEEFKSITSKNCAYCGSPPIQTYGGHEKLNGQYLHNGIDRVDNTKGYVDGNIVPCCKTCNYAKRNMTREEFLLWIQRVYNHTMK